MTLPWATVWAVFVLSRLFFVLFEPEESTADHLYFQYALQFERAIRAGESFYELHDRLAGEAMAEARRAGRTPPADETRLIEYPPLAILAIALPMRILGWFTPDLAPSPGLAWRYALIYRAEMALFDLLGFVCVIVLSRRAFPEESAGERRERLWLYVVAGPALCHVLYDRLDLALAALIVLSLTLLTSRRHYAWSFAVLALAIHFKLVPLVLIPVWLLGAASPHASSRGHFLARLGMRGVVMALLILIPLLVFHAWLGPRCLDFLRYHRTRGLQVESTWSSLLLLLGPLAGASHIEHSHQAFDLVSPLASVFTWLASWIVLAGLLLAMTFLARSVQRARLTSGLAHATFARTYPAAPVGYTLLSLLIAIAGGSVFSPQYLLWLVPLAPLAPFRGKARQVFLCTFLAACLLTTLLFPYLYWKELVRISYLPGGERVYDAPDNPSALGVVVLVARNALVIGLCVAVFVRLVRWCPARPIEEGGT